MEIIMLNIYILRRSNKTKDTTNSPKSLPHSYTVALYSLIYKLNTGPIIVKLNKKSK